MLANFKAVWRRCGEMLRIGPAARESEPEAEQQLAIAEEAMLRYRNTLRALAHETAPVDQKD
jgi:hypothetical protein